jgi:hypothetical protein
MDRNKDNLEMKYLKLFNESIDKENLTDLCDMCLAYLMDDGYEYEIQEWNWLDYKVIKFDNKLIENKSYYWPNRYENMFKWSDIKNHFIPFLEMLSRQYRIKDVKMDIITEWEEGAVVERIFMETYLSTLTEDRLDDNIEIKNISISVSEKPKPKKGFISKIKSLFESFENSDTLYVFDFDDTLVNTPEFEGFVIEYLTEDVSIKEIVDKSTATIGVNKSDLKWQDGRIYIEDPSENIEVKGNWVRKGKRVYLMAPDIFGTTDLSLPTELLDLADFYNSIENKCIVTARSEEIRDKIEKVMKELGLEYPKYGLHMYPYKNHYNAGGWKGEKIVELVGKTGFNKVIFYDDNIKYLKGATKVIKSKLPNLDYKYVKV